MSGNKAKPTTSKAAKGRGRKSPPKSRKKQKRNPDTGKFKKLYKKAFHPAMAAAMCRLGATAADLAIEFGVATSTISVWLTKHPEFAAATKAGRRAATRRVEKSLYQRAIGYDYPSEEIFCHEGRVTRVQTIKHVPADVKAGQYILNNRKPRQYKSKVEVSGNPDAPIGTAIVLMPPKEPRKDG